MSIDELVAAVHARGCRVNNLFEHPLGGWQANVCDGRECYEFGRGETMTAALAQAHGKVPKPKVDLEEDWLS